jgi:hypothetical protein
MNTHFKTTPPTQPQKKNITLTMNVKKSRVTLQEQLQQFGTPTWHPSNLAK